jgi:hypothetical protein
MARIITLGCEVADVYRRYAKIHSALFGASSYRLVVSALVRRGGYTYGKYVRSLDELRGRISRLEEDISGIGNDELSSRGAGELHRALLEYTRVLTLTIAGLTEMCRRLAENEKGYRNVAADGRSRFIQDKIGYDHAISELERVGLRLNKLFSTY